MIIRLKKQITPYIYRKEYLTLGELQVQKFLFKCLKLKYDLTGGFETFIYQMLKENSMTINHQHSLGSDIKCFDHWKINKEVNY